MPEFDYNMTRQCNTAMSRNEVVDLLRSEHALLRSELEQRDKIVANLMEQLPQDIEESMRIDYPSIPWSHIKAQLAVVKSIYGENLQIHDDLRGIRDWAEKIQDRSIKKGQEGWSEAARERDRRMMEQTRHYSG